MNKKNNIQLEVVHLYSGSPLLTQRQDATLGYPILLKNVINTYLTFCLTDAADSGLVRLNMDSFRSRNNKSNKKSRFIPGQKLIAIK